MIHISSAFDSGNIKVIDASAPADIQLEIKPDNASDFFQWFHFRMLGAKGTACSIRLVNASEAAYPQGWCDYRAVASYDRQEWFRVPSSYDGRELVISHTPEHDSIFYAYFAPYSYERHLDLIAQSQKSPNCRLLLLGKSVDGRDLDLLRITDHQSLGDKRKIWITARQHPGESMAEWFMEGVIERLIDNEDELAKALLKRAVFHLVPNANPDGSIRGHLRTNALGVNLNREWQAPSMERSPEVFHLLEAMQATGVDLYLDIHGDEALAYNFVAGCESNPGFSARLSSLEALFKKCFLAATPEFQVAAGYEKGRFGSETLSLASNQVGYRFDCLAFTIEMPFKDNADRPEPLKGWSPERSKQLGHSVLQPIHDVLDQLR